MSKYIHDAHRHIQFYKTPKNYILQRTQRTNKAYRSVDTQWRIDKKIVEVRLGTIGFTFIVYTHLIFSEHSIRLFVRLRNNRDQFHLSQCTDTTQ